MLALISLIACLTDSPSAEVTVQTKSHTEHGTVLAPCKLTIEANYDRLVRLMASPLEAKQKEVK